MKEKLPIQPYVTYATTDDLNKEANARANNDALISGSLTTLSNDYQNFKTSTNANLNNKQNKSDNTLTTNNKTVVGAINELKSTTDAQTTNITNNTQTIAQNTNAISQNTTDIADLKSKTDDFGTQLDLKQNITEDSLTTSDKTVPGAINELKAICDTQTTNINNNTNSINQNNSDIQFIKDNYSLKTNTNDALDLKQDKTDSDLTTQDKTVVGAINELVTNLGSQGSSVTEIQNQVTTNTNAINQNTSNINEIKADYAKASDVTEALNLKQNITDDSLTTNDKTVSGAINELATNLASQGSNVTEIQDQITANTDAINQNTSEINAIQADYAKASDVSNWLNLKQDKMDDSLNTSDKTVPGAINELLTSVQGQGSSVTEIQNQLTTNTNAINQNTSDITDLKAKNDELTSELALKQNINDDSLTTTNKTVVGAINELATNLGSQGSSVTEIQNQVTTNTDAINQNTNNINQNTSDINEIKADYAKTADVTNALNLKQDKMDDNLTTTEKTVVGAINELKSTTDTQGTTISANTSIINQNSSDIQFIKDNYSLKTVTDSKQDKTDSDLTTQDKTVVGAINELVTNLGNQGSSVTEIQNQVTTNTNAITQNTSDIADLKTKTDDATTQLALKQNITDETLTTDDKTIVGAINELNSDKVNNSDFAAFQANVIQNQGFVNDSLNNKQDKADANLLTADITVVGAINELKLLTDSQTTSINTNTTNIALKQDKADNALNTTNKTVVGAINELKSVNDSQSININNNTTTLTLKQNITDNSLATVSKTIVGAINEIKTNIPSWTTVGTSVSARSWSYNLVINKRYRVGYNWNGNDTTSKNYREFVWTGNNMSLETYADGFSFVTILNISVLGTANFADISATATGIQITTKSGTSTTGRIISLEQAS